MDWPSPVRILFWDVEDLKVFLGRERERENNFDLIQFTILMFTETW